MIASQFYRTKSKAHIVPNATIASKGDNLIGPEMKVIGNLLKNLICKWNGYITALFHTASITGSTLWHVQIPAEKNMEAGESRGRGGSFNAREFWLKTAVWLMWLISKISFTVVYSLRVMKRVGGCQAAVSGPCEKVLQLTKEINLCALCMS